MNDKGRRGELLGEIKRLMEQSGIKHHPRLKVDYYTSYFANLYDWELFFDGVALAYFGDTEFAINGIRMFLADQRDNGFTPRRVLAHPIADVDPGHLRETLELEEEEHCKPFLCQLALMISRTRGDISWLSAPDFTGLKQYLTHWLSGSDRDGNSLSEWNSGPHSGADTQFARIGTWRSCYCEGVDLNCYLYRECLAAAELASALDLADDSDYFRERAVNIERMVQELFWNEREGFYYDRDIRTGQVIRVKTSAGFLPLWAGLANAEQAKTLVDRHLKNPTEFWTPLPVPSYARTEPDYTQHFIPEPGDTVFTLTDGHGNWNGGMWPHVNYLIVHGLNDYGYKGEAALIAGKFYSTIERDNELFEWYDAETGLGKGLHPFWAGASILGILAPVELERNFDPIGPDRFDVPLDFSDVRREAGILTPFQPVRPEKNPT